jgi:hypothetical protein
MINISVCAESLQEAVDAVIEKQDELRTIPNGSLNLDLSNIIVIPIEPKTFS